jgi:hypothetical protein
MPEDSPPDAISSERLAQLLGQAHQASDRAELLGTAVPVLPLKSEDFGAVDLQLAVEQLLQAADGATALHMLHAGSFLLHCAANAIKRRLVDSQPELDGIHGVLFKMASLSLVHTISACIGAISDFIDPMTMFHAEKLGGGPGSRKGLISDGALKALGLDVETYDREFKRRIT